MLRIIIFILPFLFPGALWAQKTPVASKDTAIAKLFDKPADIKWVKNFKGRMDDAALVDLTLGFDGKHCRGYLSYPKTKTRIRLEGVFDTSEVRLEERETTGGPLSGRLVGKYQKRRLEGEWTNHNQELGGKFAVDEMAPGQSSVLNCSDNKWSSRYITRYNNARCDMLLVRTQNGALDGFLWVESDAKNYRLKGDIMEDGNYEIEVLLPNGKLAAVLQGNLKPGQNTDCNWVGSGERRSFKFSIKDHFLLGCYESADYFNQYDVLYPRTPCANCNTWLDQQVNNWINTCKTTFSAAKEPRIPTNRSTRRASAWPEVTTWTDQVFAGYLIFSDTWTGKTRGLAFNFDLKTGKNIVYDDIFNKTFNAKGWLDDFVKREMPKLPPFANDPQYREWLNKEGFPLFTLRREGLELSTIFHPRYGRQTLLVGYEQLKPYMKKDNPITEFVK